MVVGVCRIALSLAANDSLKGKRSVVRRIVGRTKNKFNVAAAEVADLDAHRRAVLGFAVVSNDTSHANSMLDHITSFVAGLTEAVITGRTLEILHIEGELAPLPSFDVGPLPWDDARDDHDDHDDADDQDGRD